MHSIIKLPSAASSQITVSNTAKSINDFITEAAGSDFVQAKLDINALDLQVESESIRYLCDGNTPTSAYGFLLASTTLSVKTFRGEEIGKLKLIRSGSSDATVNIQVGKM